MIPYLKNKVISKFGQAVLTLGDCKELSKVIFAETQELLNYNTLRRIFGLIKPTTPQTYTLDVLSKYVGYSDYQDFIKAMPFDYDWFHLFETFNTDDFNVSQLLLQSPPGIIGLFLRELFIMKRYPDALKVLNNPNFKSYLDDYDTLIIIGGVVGAGIRMVPIDPDFQSDFCKNPVFQESILCIFVDYESLNGHYGTLVSKSLEYPGKNDYFFQGVLNLQHFLNLKALPYSPSEMQITANTHPILMSRIVSNKILWNRTNGFKLSDGIEEHAAFLDRHEANNIIGWHEIMIVALLLDDADLYRAIENHINTDDIQALYHFHHYHLYLLFKIAHQTALGNQNAASLQLEDFQENKLRYSYLPLLRFFIHRNTYRLSSASEEKQRALAQLQDLAKRLAHPYLVQQLPT